MAFLTLSYSHLPGLTIGHSVQSVILLGSTEETQLSKRMILTFTPKVLLVIWSSDGMFLPMHS